MPIINRKKEIPLLPLLQKFIKASATGKRLQANGKRITKGSIDNYEYALKLVTGFSTEKEFVLRFRPVKYLNKRELQAEKKYWTNFYHKFTEYLYKDCGHFDNYVGQTLKVIRTFCNYLNKDIMMGIGEFHKSFFVSKEDVPVLTLLPEELNFMIYNEVFAQTLSRKLQEAKNVFVFGCTVALRFSDLMALKKTNLRKVNNDYYLVVRSKKTATDTQIRLPDYAIAILKNFKLKGDRLLPGYYLSTLNDQIKLVCEKAGFTQPVNKSRSIRGKLTEIKNSKEETKTAVQYRFCDLVSSHTMRRTAITTMLCLGMPEQVVRKISGHSPMSKEFFRYISLAQSYQDNESTKMFEILKSKTLVS